MATVLHRTTKQCLKSVNTPDYPVEDWIVNPDLSAVTGVAVKYWKITGDVVSEMSAAEKTAVDDDPTNLAALRATRYTAIDARTQELISAGFYHSNVLFSLSREAQLNLLGMKIGIDDGTVTFPQPYSTKDDGIHVLADATEGHEFFDQALAVKKTYLETGAAMKVQIKAAASRAQVDAVVDDRAEEPYGPGGSSSD